MTDEPQETKTQSSTISTSWTRDQWLKLYGILASLLVAIIAIVGLRLGQNNVAEQLEHAKNATQLQWRPYLITEQRHYAIALSYLLGENPDAQPAMLSNFASVPMNTAAFLAVRFIGIDANRDILFRNIGATPLRITSIMSSTATDNEWRDKYHSDPEILVDSIRGFREYDTLKYDIVVLPNDSVWTTEKVGIARRMPKEHFMARLKEDSLLVIYPYLYVEYSDNFGEKYNLLLLEKSEIRISRDSSDCLSFPSKTAPPQVFKYQWDIGLGQGAHY